MAATRITRPAPKKTSAAASKNAAKTRTKTPTEATSSATTKKPAPAKSPPKTPAKPTRSASPASTGPERRGGVGYWLIKSEPSVYGWSHLVADGVTRWDGVRNFEARNNLRGMCAGDLCLYYHSNEGKEIVGVARVRREAYPDPTAPGEDWSSVDIEPAFPLERPVTLAEIKATPAFSKMLLVARPRISVVPVTPPEFDAVIAMAKTAAS